MDRFFESPFGRRYENWGSNQMWNLPLDVVEKEDEYVVRASIPGMNPDDIDVSISDNVLTVRGQTQQADDVEEERYLMRERRYGSFTRSISFPMSIDSNNAEATCENGELVLRLPKAEAARPRRISIGGGGQRVIEGRTGAQGASYAEGQAATAADRARTTTPGEGFAEGQAATTGADQVRTTTRGQGFAEGQAETGETDGGATTTGKGFAEGQAAQRDRSSWTGNKNG
jgi:HSP20 family protein